jgi:hypothetical protein
MAITRMRFSGRTSRSVHNYLKCSDFGLLEPSRVYIRYKYMSAGRCGRYIQDTTKKKQEGDKREIEGRQEGDKQRQEETRGRQERDKRETKGRQEGDKQRQEETRGDKR